MDIEEKYAVALAVICVILWAASFVIGKALGSAPPRVTRTLVPVLALVTMAIFATFVAIARFNVKG
ncbi:MAG TPA: hypothetical protein VFT62_10235 [Mycobacteriales bacterium]|nr:hypothetical protein [Mycobacteriales bacterium]